MIKILVLNHKYLSWLQFFTNWLMQGILHADKSERIYKILFTLCITATICLVYFLKNGNISLVNFCISFTIAHTSNWIINCNFFVLLIHRTRIKKISKNKLFNHLKFIRKRFSKLKNNDWVLYCVSHGGICNGTMNEHSDIDISIIRKPGFINFIRSIFFYVIEKKIADYKGIPLDIFICDSPEKCIERSGYQDNPVVKFDHNNQIDFYYPNKNKISIEESIFLNKH